MLWWQSLCNIHEYKINMLYNVICQLYLNKTRKKRPSWWFFSMLKGQIYFQLIYFWCFRPNYMHVYVYIYICIHTHTHVFVVVVESISCILVTLWTVACQAPLSMGFPRKNTGVDCQFLLQGIFPIQGSNFVTFIGR